MTEVAPEQMALAVSPELAAEAANQGMAQAWKADRVQEWKIRAGAWLEDLPSGSEFVSDDLVADVGLPDLGPNRNNVVGAFFSGQAKRGSIRFAGRMRRSKRIIRHGNPQRVWVKA